MRDGGKLCGQVPRPGNASLTKPVTEEVSVMKVMVLVKRVVDDGLVAIQFDMLPELERLL